jgi:outer membrane protein, heavy metal efflux system
MRSPIHPRGTFGNAARVIGLAWIVACQHVDPAPLSAERSAAALEARSLEDPGLRGFLERQLETSFAPWPPARLDLTWLTLAALYFQPRLDVARAQLAVARGGIETAAQRPNPSLALEPEWNASSAANVSPWVAALHFDWPLETAHKRQHRIDRADALAASAERAVAVEAWRIRRDLRAALADAVSSRRRVALLRERLAVQQQIVDRAEHRVAAGAATQADTMLQRLVLLAAEAELADAERSHAGTRAQVAAVVGVPGRALDGFDLDYPLGEPGDPIDALDETEARRTALQRRADVLAALDDYAASEAALRLELAKQWPDLNLGSGYVFDQGENKWGLSVSLDLPVMNQNQGPIAEAVAARGEAAARFVALQAQVIADLDLGFAQLRADREQTRRFQALVAEQRRAAARIRAARAEGASDRFAELAAEADTQRSEITLLDAQLALDRSRALLEATVQGPLPLDADPLRSTGTPVAGETP